jgi:hypothetical protein
VILGTPAIRAAFRQVRQSARDAASLWPFRNYEVPDQPNLDSAGHAFFAKRIERTKSYLEYGSGGSTILACRFVDCLVSIDSDARFLGAVQRIAGQLARRPPRLVLTYVDIGVTGEWGVPVFKKLTAARRAKWRAYPLAGWGQMLPGQPDTILIDGRFRVACVLNALLQLEDGSPCQILVDDYFGRDHYKLIEKHARLLARAGRMAVFEKPMDFDRARCLADLDAFCKDWR